jgi:transcriptional regulator with XRE-family HTH domain
MSKKLTVAEYLSGAVALSGKTQAEIAEALGYTNANMISLLKAGKTKLPINRVEIMAKALGVDPLNLLRIAMTEYMPETWDTIVSIMGDRIVSLDERKLLNLATESTEGLGLDMSDGSLVHELQLIFAKHHKTANKDLHAAAAEYKKKRPTA